MEQQWVEHPLQPCHHVMAHIWTIVATAGYADEARAFCGISQAYRSSDGLRRAMYSSGSDKTIQRAFLYACKANDVALMQMLLPHGNKRGLFEARHGTNAGVHLAAMEGHAEVLRCLIAACPEVVNMKDSSGQTTSLHLGAEHGQVEALKVLLEHTDVNKSDSRGRTAAMCAALHGQHRLLKWMLSNVQGVDLEKRDTDGVTLLVHALVGCDGPTVHTVLAHGAVVDPQARYAHGRTLLHYTCSYDAQGMLVQRLLDAGADVHAHDNVGLTPLMLAARAGNANIVQILAGHRIGNRVQWPRLEPVGLLDAVTEPSSVEDHLGLTAAHFAAMEGNISVLQRLQNLHHPEFFNVVLRARTRLIAGPGPAGPAVAGPALRNRYNMGEEDWEELEREHALGMTPLMMACSNGHLADCPKVIEFLLLYGFASVQNSMRRGLALLTWCCGQGYTDGVRVLLGPAGKAAGVTVDHPALSLDPDMIEDAREEATPLGAAINQRAYVVFRPDGSDVAHHQTTQKNGHNHSTAACPPSLCPYANRPFSR